LKIAHEIDPENTLVLLVLCQHYCITGDLEKAANILPSLQNHLNRFENTKQFGSYKILALYRHLSGFINHVQRGIGAASADYESAFLHWGAHPKILFGYGQFCIFRGLVDKAVEAFSQIRNQGIANFDLLRVLGSLEAHHDKEKARQILKKAVSLNPGDVELLVEYAQVCEDYDVKEAADAYLKAIDFYNRRKGGKVPYQLLNNYAAVLFSLNEFDNAEKHIYESLHVLGENKIHPAIFFNLGLVQEAKGDLFGACQVYQKIIDSDENQHAPYFDAFLRVGGIKETVGDFVGAESEYQKIISLEENNEKGLLALGNLWLNRKDKSDDEKLSQAEKFFTALGSHEYAQLSLASIYVKRFQFEKRKKNPVSLFSFIIFVHIFLSRPKIQQH
jgi:tetratricopeptide (TPR) repeat protein